MEGAEKTKAAVVHGEDCGIDGCVLWEELICYMAFWLTKACHNLQE